MDIGYYKLNIKDLQTFSNMRLINPVERDNIIEVAHMRQPGKFLRDKTVKAYRVYLNKAKTVWIQPVHFYGGENFGKPHLWLAEITGSTQTGITRFMNKYDIQLPYIKY